jgi:peptide/nickel transport system permease protein
MSTTPLTIDVDAAAPPIKVRRLALRPGVVIGTTVLLMWLVIVLFASWIAPYGSLDSVGTRLQGPSTTHWFGTDALGRDVFSRVLHGARQSLPTSFAVIVCAVAIGSLLGLAAGYLGGWVDACVMRLTDVVLAFPPIFLAMAVAATLGPGLRHGFIAILIVWWPIYARLIRAQVLSLRDREHVEAAVSIGATKRRIVRKHVLPLAYTPVMINATMDFGQVVILTASLSFLGLGALPPNPEWGAMITEGARNFYDWWIAGAAGLAILTVVLATNFLGDGLRDVFDPRSRDR